MKLSNVLDLLVTFVNSLINGVLRGVRNSVKTVSGAHSAHLITNPLDLVVESPHFLQVSDFVHVSLLLEILAIFVIHALPGLSNSLHDN